VLLTENSDGTAWFRERIIELFAVKNPNKQSRIHARINITRAKNTLKS